MFVKLFLYNKRKRKHFEGSEYYFVASKLLYLNNNLILCYENISLMSYFTKILKSKNECKKNYRINSNGIEFVDNIYFIVLIMAMPSG